MDAPAHQHHSQFVMTGTVQFVLPANWRTITGHDLTGLRCEASTVGQALTWLSEAHPVLRERIFTADEELAPWIVVSLGDEDVRTYQGLDTPIADQNDKLRVIPALMGG
jgi:molybdopterin synthase sulfur carrier subunit